MAETLFQYVARTLQETTILDKLEARGTLRIALRQAGLDASGVTPEQMRVVLERALAKELGSRGVARPERVCGDLVSALERFEPAGGATRSEAPEEVFRRLGGRSGT